MCVYGIKVLVKRMSRIFGSTLIYFNIQNNLNIFNGLFLFYSHRLNNLSVLWHASQEEEELFALALTECKSSG